MDGRKSIITRIVIVIVFGVLFTIFSARTHFLGDGYELINTIGSTATDIIKWSEAGSVLIATAIQALIGETNKTNAETAFRIISIFSGLVSIWFFFIIARIATENPAKRFLILTSLLLSGGLLLFFGYVENYPLLWPVTLGFIYFGLKYLGTSRGLWIVGLLLVIDFALHMQSAVLIPAFVYLAFSRGTGSEIYRKYKKALIVGGITGLLVILALFVYKYLTDLYIQDVFLPLFIGKPIDPDYAILRLDHLIDIFNELTLVSPLIILFVILSVKRFKNIMKNNSTVFMALVSGGYLLFLFVIDPKLALPRDWDLFAITGPPLTVLTIISIDRKWIDSIKKAIVPILCFLVTAPIPFLYANLNENLSREYIQYVIDTDFKRSMSSLVVLYNHYGDIGETKKADSLKTIYNTRYPYKFKLDNAQRLYTEGNYAASRAIMNSLPPDKFNVNYHTFMCQLYFQEGKLEKALESIDKAIQLKKYIYVNYYNRAMIYSFMKRDDKVLNDLKTAHRLNADDIKTVQFLASFYFTHEDYDSTIVFAYKLLELDPKRPDAHYFLAEAYYSKGRYDSTKKYIMLYSTYGEPDRLFDERSKWFDELTREIDSLQR
jgi:tetratricopeptide (TPR) repeat protein